MATNMATNMAANSFPSNTMPGNWRRRNSARNRLPAWIRNDLVRTRVLRVYQMYTARSTMPDIAREMEISVEQVYADIKLARQEARFRFQGDLENIVMEQVEARHAIINRAYTAYSLVQNDPTITVLAKTRAYLDLLALVSSNEAAVEDMLMVRGPQGAISDLPPTTDKVVIIDMSSRRVHAQETFSPSSAQLGETEGESD